MPLRKLLTSKQADLEMLVCNHPYIGGDDENIEKGTVNKNIYCGRSGKRSNYQIWSIRLVKISEKNMQKNELNVYQSYIC